MTVPIDGTRKACDIPQCLNDALPDANYCGKHNAQGTDEPYGGRKISFTTSPRPNMLYRDVIRGFDALIGEIDGTGEGQRKTSWMAVAWHRRLTWLRWLRELKCYAEDKETMALARIVQAEAAESAQQASQAEIDKLKAEIYSIDLSLGNRSVFDGTDSRKAKLSALFNVAQTTDPKGDLGKALIRAEAAESALASAQEALDALKQG